MNSYSRLRVNRPKVVDETIDGEVVMINLESGSYYSTDKVGAEIWNTIDGKTPTEIATAMALRYSGDRDEIELAVVEFMNKLHGEKLIAVDDQLKGSAARLATSNEARELLKPFVKPDLQKYDDMQDLLLADPIHDFNEAGWPQENKA